MSWAMSRVALAVRLVLAAMVLVVAFSPSTAVAQPAGPLISDLIEIEDSRLVVPADTAAKFIQAARADADQAAAARALVDGSRVALSRAINRYLRDERDDVGDFKKRRQALAESVRRIEREMLTDLRSLLREEQERDGATARFERAHRRALAATVTSTRIGLDLWAFLREAKIDPKSNADLDAALERYDVEGDRLLVQYLQARAAFFNNARGGFDGSDEARRESNRVRRELNDTQSRLQTLYNQTLDAVLPLLPEAIAQRLSLRTLASLIGWANADRGFPARENPVLREVLQIRLSPEQRASLDELIARADRDAAAEVNAFRRDETAYDQLSPEAQQQRRGQSDDPLNRLVRRIGEVRKRLESDAIALLTPEQKLEYDALPVIAPPREPSGPEVKPVDAP